MSLIDDKSPKASPSRKGRRLIKDAILDKIEVISPSDVARNLAEGSEDFDETFVVPSGLGNKVSAIADKVAQRLANVEFLSVQMSEDQVFSASDIDELTSLDDSEDVLARIRLLENANRSNDAFIASLERHLVEHVVIGENLRRMIEAEKRNLFEKLAISPAFMGDFGIKLRALGVMKRDLKRLSGDNILRIAAIIKGCDVDNIVKPYDDFADRKITDTLTERFSGSVDQASETGKSEYGNRPDLSSQGDLDDDDLEDFKGDKEPSSDSLPSVAGGIQDVPADGSDALINADRVDQDASDISASVTGADRPQDDVISTAEKTLASTGPLFEGVAGNANGAKDAVDPVEGIPSEKKESSQVGSTSVPGDKKPSSGSTGMLDLSSPPALQNGDVKDVSDSESSESSQDSQEDQEQRKWIVPTTQWGVLDLEKIGYLVEEVTASNLEEMEALKMKYPPQEPLSSLVLQGNDAEKEFFQRMVNSQDILACKTFFRYFAKRNNLTNFTENEIRAWILVGLELPSKLPLSMGKNGWYDGVLIPKDPGSTRLYRVYAKDRSNLSRSMKQV